jgi:undecaprenyl-diphosphatase
MKMEAQKKRIYPYRAMSFFRFLTVPLFLPMFLLANHLLQKLEQWDRWLFIEINNHQSNSFFDGLMPFLRNSFTWIPLYVFLFFFAVLNFKGRAWWWVVIFLCVVSLTDIVSSRIFKETFERLRPCADPDFIANVRLLLNRCSGGASFTSSHAANHFGMAVFIFITLRAVFKNWVWLALLWAVAVGYAQVYVGVHYPFDILGGAVIGVLFGLLMGVFFNKRFGFANFEN